MKRPAQAPVHQAGSGENDFPILPFPSAAPFRSWLEANHASVPGVWLRFAKKGSPEKSITYAEALDQALCFGWIDGLRKPLDQHFWLQRYTPRRARSGWSRINTQHVERLMQGGLMAPAGLRTVEASKADGRWQAAYASPRHATPPPDFLRLLRTSQPALAFFKTLSRANLYAIFYRLETARQPETRERRMQLILSMLERGEAFHPLRARPWGRPTRLRRAKSAARQREANGARSRRARA